VFKGEHPELSPPWGIHKTESTDFIKRSASLESRTFILFFQLFYEIITKKRIIVKLYLLLPLGTSIFRRPWRPYNCKAGLA
jgi:hypothetical protein